MARNANRKDTILKMYIIAIIGIIIGVVFVLLFFNETKLSIITFNEKSSTDYKVFLKENKYYEKNYLEKDNQYIASLIDKVQTNFKYDMNITNRFDYVYNYKVVAEVEVKDISNENTIYKFEEDLLDKKDINSSGKLVIDEVVDVDYPKYNDLIGSFKNTYELTNSKSTLNINLYLNVKDFSNSKSEVNKKVATLELPLVENTISINKTNTKDTVNFNVSDKGMAYIFLIFGALILVTSLLYIVYIIIYSLKSRTAEMIYEKELKNIKTNYDSYIQHISDTYDIGTSQVIKIQTFNDILEIRDTLKQPILMLENTKKNGTFFIIPATNSIIYVYALRVVDIEAKLEGKEIPVFDVTEIPHTDFTTNKKYTEDFIKDEINRTASMPTIDESNVIKGNKDKEKDLYEQLELTQSFSVDEIKKAVRKAKRRKENRKSKKANKKTK